MFFMIRKDTRARFIFVLRSTSPFPTMYGCIDDMFRDRIKRISHCFQDRSWIALRGMMNLLPRPIIALTEKNGVHTTQFRSHGVRYTYMPLRTHSSGGVYSMRCVEIRFRRGRLYFTSSFSHAFLKSVFTRAVCINSRQDKYDPMTRSTS